MTEKMIELLNRIKQIDAEGFVDDDDWTVTGWQSTALRTLYSDLYAIVMDEERPANAEWLNAEGKLSDKDAEIARLREALEKIDSMWGETKVHEIARAALCP